MKISPGGHQEAPLAKRKSNNIHFFLLLSFNLFLCPLVMLLLLGQLVAVASALAERGMVIEPSVGFTFIDMKKPSSQVLTCRPSGDDPSLFSNIHWNGPNSTDNWQELEKKHIVREELNSPNSWELQFKNPTHADSGIYTCTGTFSSTDVYSAKISVVLTNPVEVHECQERQAFLEGQEDAKIHCFITTDLPKATISKDGKSIDRYGDRYKWNNKDALIIVGPVVASDEGVYSISIKSSITGRRETRSIYVHVDKAPEIHPFTDLDPSGKYHAIEGEPFQIKCNASGRPRPLITWRDPKLRNLTTVGGYIVDQERGILHILKVNKRDDNGLFECIATGLGSAHLSVPIVVDIRPTIVGFPNKTVTEGLEAVLECRASGEPRPSFSIRKEGLNQQPYKLGESFVKGVDTTPEGGGSDVYVHRLKIIANRTMFGTHYCNASNQAGSSEQKNYLAVNFRPDLSLTPRVQFITIGKNFSVTCLAKAYPTPTISWRSDSIQLINVKSHIKTDEHFTHVITMEPPAQTTFSKFICEARNNFGEDRVEIVPRYSAEPDQVQIRVNGTTPTTVRLTLSVPNDGGNRVKVFKYSFEGRPLNPHAIFTNQSSHRIIEEQIEALPSPIADYIIRNLRPFYIYSITLKAKNDIGLGPANMITVETPKATKPDPPNIIRPGVAQASNMAIVSEYQDGYTLIWNPPALDNGEPIIKYSIRYSKLPETESVNPSQYQTRYHEQPSDLPMKSTLGPLEPDNRYLVNLHAINIHGESDPATITIITRADRPQMPELVTAPLDWFMSLPPHFMIYVLLVVVPMLVLVDLLFCSVYQIGIIYKLRTWCIPPKATSVVGEKSDTE